MKESLMRAHTGVATVGGASKGSLVTLLCGLSGTKDTSTFNPPMTKRDYSDPSPFSSVVARHRLMDAAMNFRVANIYPGAVLPHGVERQAATQSTRRAVTPA